MAEYFGTLAEMDRAPKCSVCGWPQHHERDKDGCGNCREIERRNEDRFDAAANIGRATKHYTEARGFRDKDNATAEIATALDHYIARSSQGWVR